MRALFMLAALCWLCASLCHGYGILTKNMIKTPEETRYEPVPLVIRDEAARELKSSGSELQEEVATVRNDYEDEETDEDLDEEDEEEEEDDEDYVKEEPPNDEVKPTGGAQTQMVATDEEASVDTRIPPTGRTRLYPVGRLWEKTSPDIWAVLSVAVNCLWSGLGMDCFKFRVVPMVKSMMGYQYTDFMPYYLTPRNDAVTDREEGRRRRHHLLGIVKLLKGALAGAIGLKTLLLPVLAGLAIVAGKSLFLSLASVILSGAAAWTGVKSVADRRVQAGTPENHPQYYMM